MRASSNLDKRACFYANKLDRRPACEGVATIAYGATALCTSCDTRRSTVGKGITPKRLVVERNHLAEITDAERCVAEAQQALDERVLTARQHGCSWTTIAMALGTSRQAAHQRYATTTGTKKGGNLA